MRTTPLLTDSPLPLVPELEPDTIPYRDAAAARRWARANAEDLLAVTRDRGVVLIRGYNISTPEDFRLVCHAITPDLKNYVGGDSPRTGVADQVYTSTEYDPALEVLLHNELSYAGWSPALVYFGCLVPAMEGGETPVADGREIYRTLPPDIRDRFEKRGIAYLQHLWDANGPEGIGKSWQETFESEDRASVEAYLTESGMTWEWTEFGIRTRAVHPAVVAHPMTGEMCWRNQADQWHRGFDSVKISVGALDDPRFDPNTAGEETLGNHVTFADGGEIDLADLEAVRATTRACEVVFPWRAGDIMIIDNILAMHGRKPYRGPRRVLVAMA